MVPALWMALAELPLTANGKVDRRALPPVDAGHQLEHGYVEPRNELERALAQIWQEVLQVERVGIEDDFFDLGGDSIRALRVQAQAQERGYEFALLELFRTRTIAAIAPTVQAVQRSTAHAEPFGLLSECDRARAQAH